MGESGAAQGDRTDHDDGDDDDDGDDKRSVHDRLCSAAPATGCAAEERFSGGCGGVQADERRASSSLWERNGVRA